MAVEAADTRVEGTAVGELDGHELVVAGEGAGNDAANRQSIPAYRDGLDHLGADQYLHRSAQRRIDSQLAQDRSDGSTVRFAVQPLGVADEAGDGAVDRSMIELVRGGELH